MWWGFSRGFGGGGIINSATPVKIAFLKPQQGRSLSWEEPESVLLATSSGRERGVWDPLAHVIPHGLEGGEGSGEGERKCAFCCERHPLRPLMPAGPSRDRAEIYFSHTGCVCAHPNAHADSHIHAIICAQVPRGGGVGGDKEYKIGDEVVGWNGACLCACQAEIYSSTADFRRKTLTDDTAYACSPKQHTCLIAVKRSRDNTGETTKQARWANRQRDGSLGRAELPAPRSHHSLSARAHETRTSWNGKKNNITACKKSIKHEAERGWKIEGVKNEQIVVKRYQRSLRWLLHTAEMWDVYMKQGDWWCDIHVSACVWSLTVKKKKPDNNALLLTFQGIESHQNLKSEINTFPLVF